MNSAACYSNIVQAAPAAPLLTQPLSGLLRTTERSWLKMAAAGEAGGQAGGGRAGSRQAGKLSMAVSSAAACQQLCSAAAVLCRALVWLRCNPRCALQLLTRHAADDAHRREEEDALGQGALSEAAHAPGT